MTEDSRQEHGSAGWDQGGAGWDQGGAGRDQGTGWQSPGGGPGDQAWPSAPPAAGADGGYRPQQPPYAAQPGPGPAHPGHRAPRRRGRGRLAAGTAVVVAAAVAAAVVLTTSGSGGQPAAVLTPRQVLVAAVHRAAGVTSMSGQISIRTSGQNSLAVNGSVQLQNSPLLMSEHMTMALAGQSIPVSMVANSSAIYLSLGGGLGAGLPAVDQGKWLKIPYSELGLGSEFASLQQSLQNANPLTQEQQLLAATHLRKAGTAEVDGVPVTRYSGQVAPSAALKELPAATRAQLAPELKQLTGNIAVSAWIDGQHRIRKLTETEKVAGSTVLTTATITSYNQPVHVTIPPASQVVVPPKSALTGGS